MKQRRNTRQRQLVLKTVQARHDHPSADQIYMELRQTDDRISRGTVYRNLSCLSSDRQITHVKLFGADRYDCRTDLHYHLVCTSCGAVIDVPAPYQTAMDSDVAQKTGYAAIHHRTVFEGLCPSCQAKQHSGLEDKQRP